MTPTVGRIVLVTVDPNRNNGNEVAPGIITRVWSDNMVNIRVFLDGSFESPAHTSVSLYQDRDELDRAHEIKRAEMAKAGYDPVPPLIGAYWPPRV